MKLYSMESPRMGGTYQILNNLLSRGKKGEKENDVQARLFEYNADPVTGRYLAKKHKFWLHAFRILWHTIAEMNLRTAQSTPRAAAASALCVPRRPARPVPKLTSLASGRGSRHRRERQVHKLCCRDEDGQ